MSAIEHYLKAGYSPMTKTTAISGVSTIAVWTPSTSTKIVVTDMTLSTITPGTIAFYWGNLAGDKIAEFVLSGSLNISPQIGCWEGTAYDRSLFAKLVASQTDGVRVNLTGFELS